MDIFIPCLLNENARCQLLSIGQCKKKKKIKTDFSLLNLKILEKGTQNILSENSTIDTWLFCKIHISASLELSPTLA